MPWKCTDRVLRAACHAACVPCRPYDNWEQVRSWDMVVLSPLHRGTAVNAFTQESTLNEYNEPNITNLINLCLCRSCLMHAISSLTR